MYRLPETLNVGEKYVLEIILILASPVWSVMFLFIVVIIAFI